MNRILLATDLEDTAKNVAAFALTLADNFGAELTVYHAYGKPDLSLADLSDEEREARVLTRMRELIGGLTGPSAADVPLRYVADVDYPGDGIIAQVDGDRGYDLVVIGLREPAGSGAGGRGQFSSLAYRILREVEADVLAIPPGAAFHGVNEIIFASDVDRADEVVLERLQEWRQRLSSELYVVHVYDDEDDKERARKVMTKWRDRYASRPNMHFELLAGDFTEDIGRYVRDRGGDMLVLQSHTRGLFGRVFQHSAAADVAQVVEVPLLVMRGEQ